MTLTTLFAMGLAMTSPPVALTATISSLGKWTLEPRFPIRVERRRPSYDQGRDPASAHLAEPIDPQDRLVRVWTLDHEEDRVGFLKAVSLWESCGFGAAPLDFDVPGSSPVETVRVLLRPEAESLDTSQLSSTVYVFSVELEELPHSYPA